MEEGEEELQGWRRRWQKQDDRVRHGREPQMWEGTIADGVGRRAEMKEKSEAEAAIGKDGGSWRTEQAIEEGEKRIGYDGGRWRVGQAMEEGDQRIEEVQVQRGGGG
jgi:hypothetical protein